SRASWRRPRGPDGSVLATPGYDPATGLLVCPDADYPPVPEEPTHEQAVEAAQSLLDLVSEFPWASSAHQAAWLAALLTPLARPAIMGCSPLMLLDANTPGSGKSLLCDVIATLATGRDMPRCTLESDDTEMRKRITAAVLAGDRLVMLDNVVEPLGGASLDAALTGSTWRDRILGVSAMTPELPLSLTFFATGNNIMLGGDIIRRILPMRLDCAEERPEERGGWTYPDLLGVRGRLPDRWRLDAVGFPTRLRHRRRHGGVE